MRNLKTIFILVLLTILLSGCFNLATNTNQADKNTNQPETIDQDGDLEPSKGDLDQLDDDLNFYTLELGRSDSDIQSVRTYDFYLPKDVEFEVMGVDAPSTIIEFKKDNQVIFSWHNRDYVIDEDNLDIMYPDWDNYSFVGGHTNVLFFDEEENAKYQDDLYVFEDSLKINGQLVFE